MPLSFTTCHIFDATDFKLLSRPYPLSLTISYHSIAVGGYTHWLLLTSTFSYKALYPTNQITPSIPLEQRVSATVAGGYRERPGWLTWLLIDEGAVVVPFDSDDLAHLVEA